MNTFQLTVVASNAICYQGPARVCTVFGATGSRSFEAHHEAFVTVLTSPSTITFRDDEGSETRIEAPDGLLNFADNACTIVVSSMPRG